MGNRKNGKLKPRDSSRANHLKPYWFKKGHPGGPGRPKQAAFFKRAYKDLLMTEIPIDIKTSAPAVEETITQMVKRGAKIIDFIALAQVIQAMRGDTRAAAEIADRVDGKALQALRVETEAADSGAMATDLSRLTADEIETVIGLYRKAALEPVAADSTPSP